MQIRTKTLWIVLSALFLFLLCAACEGGCLEGDSESATDSSESTLDEAPADPMIGNDGADAGIPF